MFHCAKGLFAHMEGISRPVSSPSPSFPQVIQFQESYLSHLLRLPDLRSGTIVVSVIGSEFGVCSDVVLNNDFERRLDIDRFVLLNFFFDVRVGNQQLRCMHIVYFTGVIGTFNMSAIGKFRQMPNTIQILCILLPICDSARMPGLRGMAQLG